RSSCHAQVTATFRIQYLLGQRSSRATTQCSCLRMEIGSYGYSIPMLHPSIELHELMLRI
ncbi:MAG: hypothetical protein OXI33_13555, partial [Chloroflexota bacterium]|nr:hypothetical protein [Chloroflexota bacterium]